MTRPLFSCVIPVKGERPYFDAAVASLKNQGMGDELEIIVQDGDVEPDAGQSDALNKGFAKARGEWLFWLNADDLLLPDTLRKVRELSVKSPSANWIAGGTRYFTADGRKIDAKFDRRWHPWLYRHMPVWTYGPSSFFRRGLWERQGGFDLSFKYMMDIDLWTRWGMAGERFLVLPDFAWGFRVHSGSKTMGGQFDAERAIERKRLRNRYGFRHLWLWLNLQRISRIIDGSVFKR